MMSLCWMVTEQQYVIFLTKLPLRCSIAMQLYMAATFYPQALSHTCELQSDEKEELMMYYALTGNITALKLIAENDLVCTKCRLLSM